jgi:hypothetical protein
MLVQYIESIVDWAPPDSFLRCGIDYSVLGETSFAARYGHLAMNFDSLYSKVVLEAKKCEVLWFRDSVEHGLGHAFPFLSRNLLYIRRATGRRPVTKPKEAVSDGREDKENNTKQDKPKKTDLLFSVFHHRTFLYNDALLTAPRRATRKLTEASSRNTTPAPTHTPKKLKFTSLEDDDSSRDSVIVYLSFNITHCVFFESADTSFSHFLSRSP